MEVYPFLDKMMTTQPASATEATVTQDDIPVKQNEGNCREFQALKYKTMIETGNDIETCISNETNEKRLYNFLDKEIKENKRQNWNKLSKTEKIKKVKGFVNDKLTKKYVLTEIERGYARRYMTSLLERKCLSKNNELDYDEESGEINDIYIVEFNSETRKLVLNTTFVPQSKKNRSSENLSANSVKHTARKRTLKKQE